MMGAAFRIPRHEIVQRNKPNLHKHISVLLSFSLINISLHTLSPRFFLVLYNHLFFLPFPLLLILLGLSLLTPLSSFLPSLPFLLSLVHLLLLFFFLYSRLQQILQRGCWSWLGLAVVVLAEAAAAAAAAAAVAAVAGWGSWWCCCLAWRGWRRGGMAAMCCWRKAVGDKLVWGAKLSST